MFNSNALAAIISSYKQDFSKIHEEEIYKWKAVKCFQENWDENDADFPLMLHRSLEKANNLLTSYNFYPKGMICELAEKDPEAVRAMFIELFDELRPVTERIKEFVDSSEILRLKYGGGSWNNHYQSPNSVSIYLFFRYPNKYYIYKYRKFKSFALKIEYPDVPKQGKIEGVQNYYTMCNEILDIVKQDNELLNMSKGRLTEEDYPDPAFHILTEDIVFYGGRTSENTAKRTSYDDPVNISEEQWLEMLKNPSVIKAREVDVLRKWLFLDGKATCTEVGETYKEHPTAYIKPTVSMARRVYEHTKCDFRVRDDTGKTAWWNIPFTGTYTDSNHFRWIIRPELHKALISAGIVAMEPPKAAPSVMNYWWLNANPKIWSFADLRVGESQGYTLLNENGHKRRIYQNFLDAKAGDFVIGYEASPVKQIVAICKITRENDGESIYFEKVEGLSTPLEYSAIKDIPELQKMECFVNPNGSLFKLTKDEYEFLFDIIREQNPSFHLHDIQKFDSYTKSDFLSEVYLSEGEYDSLTALLEHKKNIILQGPPGVGKTFAANRLAYSILGNNDDKKVKIVQFHQSYSYEDFIMGYKPDETGFKLQNGVFYDFCKQAENCPEDKFFFIIDEINRGNLSKIFGELLMVIEKDYRDRKITMAYSPIPFSVPNNIYIIGMMNTADRSLAMIDYALRRRFSFYELYPAFNRDGFTSYQHSLGNDTLNDLINAVKELNQEITDDASLGNGFCIGHSYFCKLEDNIEERLTEIVEYDIIPMLNEYWFDNKVKALDWAKKLHGILND
jgi:5-methylcytosine-specific restriction protein B